MSFWRGLLMARGQLAFLLGLVLAGAVIAWAEHALDAPRRERATRVEPTLAELLEPADLAEPRPVVPHAPTPEERARASLAWAWFRAQADARTGLAPSVAGSRAAVTWDIGGQLRAVLDARALGVVDDAEADAALSRLLDTLSALPLLDPGLPDHAYDVGTLGFVDDGGTPLAHGSGWKATETARLVLPLVRVRAERPALSTRASAVLARFRLEALVRGGELLEGRVGADGAVHVAPEQRIVHERWAARVLALVGLDAWQSARPRAHVAIARVRGRPVPVDARGTGAAGDTGHLVQAEPFLELAVSFGLADEDLLLAQAVDRAERMREAETARPTALGSEHLDRPPGHVRAGLLGPSGEDVVVGPETNPVTPPRLLSTKVAFGWSALFQGPRAARLRAIASELHAPDAGWWSGRYESDGAPDRALASATQALVLALTAYEMRGPALATAPLPLDAAPDAGAAASDLAPDAGVAGPAPGSSDGGTPPRAASAP